MTLFRAIAVAFGLYSRVPVPAVAWTESAMRYAMCAFPLVGLVQGLLCLGWGLVAAHAGLPLPVTAAILMGIPVLVNGGIHLDGLCDMSDALASHAERERKLEILSDPHIGAFGVIALAMHVLLLAAFTYCIPLKATVLACLPCAYVLSRALSAIAVVTWPQARKQGMVRSFSDAAKTRVVAAVCTVFALAACVCLVCLQGAIGGLVVAAAFAAFAWYRFVAMRNLGGVTGDAAGWFLQTAELWMIGALVIGGVVL